MLAMQLPAAGHQLVAVDLPVPAPAPNEVLLKVRACGVCRTDLHIVDGELPLVQTPLVPGHEIVGTVAPVGALVPIALRAVRKGGVVVCAGIHMTDIPAFAYSLLWEERVLRSVANLTRADGEAFLALAAQHPIQMHTTPFPLSAANDALDALRAGAFDGAAVLLPAH